MIVRIVKMNFDESAVPAFQELFNRQMEKIRHFPGCSHLELCRDTDHLGVFYTISHWKGVSELENYRQSALFTSIWIEVKRWFCAKPEAWSLSRELCLP